MNNNHFVRISNGSIPAVLFSLFIGFLLSYCAPEPQEWAKKSNEQVAGDYIANNPDLYAEFGKLIEVTGIRSLLNIRGPFTIMLPNDSAMFAYYKLKHVIRWTILPKPSVRNWFIITSCPAKLPLGISGWAP